MPTRTRRLAPARQFHTAATPSRFRSLAAHLALTAAAMFTALDAGDVVAQQTAVDIARAEMETRYAMPPAPIGEYLQRDPNFATLDAPAPGGRYYLVPLSTELSTLELMSKPTLRLAELEIRPETDRLWHLDTYGITGLRVYDMQQREFRDVTGIPAGTFISDMVWNADGTRLAFLAHLPRGTEVWTADPTNGRASRFSNTRVLATLATSAQTSVRTSRILQWTNDGALVTLAVPSNRGPAPVRNRVPVGPGVRMTRPEPTPTRTFPNLLRDAHDADLFEYYTRAQMVELTPNGRARAIGEPRMYQSIDMSPDGRHMMVTFVERPFSLITSHSGFPRRTVVMDRDGAILETLNESGLREGGRGGFGGPGGGGAQRRSIAWRPDGAGLSFLQRDGSADQVMLLPPPFDSARLVLRSDDAIRSISWSEDASMAFATVTRNGNRPAIVAWDLREAEPQPRTIQEPFASDSMFTHPGDLWTRRTGNGTEYVIVAGNRDAVYLTGPGLKPDFRPQPFVDRVVIATGEKTRVFEGARDTWDRPLAPADDDLGGIIVSREGANLFPDSYLWTPGGAMVNLTGNRDPFPEITAARRVDFTFQRSDGLDVHGRVTLPLGYQEGQKVPALFWTYPREYTTTDGYTNATYRSRNVNAYSHLTWLRWSDLWLTQGYALVAPDIPIIGENYNDVYIAALSDAMYGAIRAIDHLGFIDMDRIGHGGHSYGAFATANLLANTPYFKAGIAGSGAYNRSLTPTGFQAEPRDIWAAQQTYLDMSPFFRVNQINAPLLMYHGADDNNTGTWPIQSERLMHALTSVGKNAVLYLYPYESHTPRAIENKLDLWARWIDWFDRYVKGSDTATVEQGSQQ
ncbi:MAG TPA: prolyl oligopeptidase family serine peptidase [Longimicrobiales bacterium]|nr:prolyl oligopeptidase family serine peptidase [Longimicrobiales bacterium]